MLSAVRSALGMMTGWARGLRPAKFRDATFYIESFGGTYGRRGPDHEYPARDTPFAEDLGRRQRTWRFTGYVIGDDYPSLRDALIKACEQEGPGELVHPTIGTVNAVCRTCTFSEERQRGRYCAFEFEFVEAGQLQEPADKTDPDSAVERAAEPVGTTATSSFLGSFSTAGGGSWLSGAASSQVTGFGQTLQQLRLPAPTSSQSGIGQALTYLTGNAGALVGNPSALASAVDSTFAAFTNAGEALQVVRAMLAFVRPARDQFGLTQWSAPLSRAAHTGTTKPLVIRRADNQTSFENFTHRLALREIGYSITGLDLDNYQQAQALLAEVLAAFAQVEEAAADAGDDEVFWALSSLRLAITRMIATRALGLNPLVTYRVVSPTPANALTLAWRLYQDSGRDLEIVDRVAARNPAFLPMTGVVLAA